MKQSPWTKILDFIGVELSPVTHKERIVSGVGAMLGILCTYFVTRLFLDEVGTICMISSMGASSVLLFGVPHGALSQPWPLVIGHLLSAVIGVMCSNILPDPLWAGPIAVALSMTVMHYGRCIHPPGGATALTAVIGGERIQQLGFEYVLTPVAMNVAIIFIVAVAFNAFFKWRRYPASLSERKLQKDLIPRDSLTFALRQMDSFIDVSEEDLEQIYTTATRHAAGKKIPTKSKQAEPGAGKNLGR